LKQIACTIFLLFLMTTAAEAQLSYNYHIIPQVADGRFPDGTSFRTHFVVSNVNAPGMAACTIRLYGVPAGRLNLTAFNLNVGALIRLATNNAETIATGYATLSCNQPVKAFAIYRYLSNTGATIGLATVFTSPPMTRAYYLPTATDRLALAVANDSDLPGDYELVARDAGGAVVASGRMAVPARTSRAAFADELMVIPPEDQGVVVYIYEGSSPAFSTICQENAGPIFKTQQPFKTVP
jgi:hypothetical protein